MNVEKLRKLVKLVEESNIEALEIRRFFRTVKITKRSSGNHNGSATNAAPQLIEVGPVAPAAQPVSPPAPAAAEPKAVVPSNLVEVKAPMVGTYYRAPAPGSPPFVEVGKTVTPGDVLCIIEAMKLMNEIEAEQAGRIAEILIEDGQPIEFGQALFLLDPAG